MSLKRRVTIGVLWMFAGGWAEQGCAFIIFAILARLLNAEAFGLVAMALIVVSLAEVLIRQTITVALIQRQQLEPGHFDAAFWLLLAMALGLTMAIVLLADLVASIYGLSEVADLLRWLSPTILFIALSAVPVAILRREMRFRPLAVRALLGVILGGVVGITMAVMGYGAWSLVGQRLTHIFVTSVMVWFARPWRPGFRATRRHFRDLRRFGIGMLGVRFTGIISTQTPSFMIGLLLGPVALGYYTIAWRIADVVLILLVQPFRNVALPAFAQVQNDLKHAGDLLQGILQVVALISFPSFLGLATVAPQALDAVVGAGWQPAIPLLQVLCLVGIYTSIERIQNLLLLGFGQVGWVFALTLMDAAFGVVVLFIAAHFGIFTVAVTIAARCYLTWPIHLFVFHRLTRINVVRQARLLLPFLVAASIMAVAVLVCRNIFALYLSGTWMLASSIVLGILVYGGVLLLVMPERVRAAVQTLRSINKPADPELP